MHEHLSVAMSAEVAAQLAAHSIREDGQEDLLFALWTPSEGATRFTALLHTPLLPQEGDREVHGNVSFNPQFFQRACEAAMQTGAGVAFAHSHPFPGWQGMSPDDIAAEHRMAGAVLSLTGLPLLGMTVGSDGTWSARFWEFDDGRRYAKRWCASVRTVGHRLHAYFSDDLLPRPQFREHFKRTLSVWGDEGHATLARLRIGIVGLGSVGAMVAETLARMGMQHISLIDFDRVEAHNLDRLVVASEGDIGRLKVDVARKRIALVGTAAALDVRAVPFSVVEEPGYRAALDCDVLFSCVDRPRARRILDHFAYNHLIPAVDGGIAVRFRERQFRGVDWQVQAVGPERACLECIGTYNAADVSTETAGKLDDPSYLAGLPSDHHFKRNENVFPFSANLASLEVLQMVAMCTGIGEIDSFGIQRYRYNPGIMDQDVSRQCSPGCSNSASIARGDADYCLIGNDLAAETGRRRSGASS